MKQKTKKAVRKRVRISGGKKIQIRAAGQDHFNARESGNVTRNKRRDKSLAKVNHPAIKRLIAMK